MKAETRSARKADQTSGLATRQPTVQDVGSNGKGRPKSPIGLMMAGSADSITDGHTTRGSNPADVNPRFGDSVANLEGIRIANLRAAAAQRRQIEPDPPAHLIRCGDCGHRIPKGRIDAVKEYGVPKRCFGCQEKWEKKYPRNPDSYR